MTGQYKGRKKAPSPKNPGFGAFVHRTCVAYMAEVRARPVDVEAFERHEHGHPIPLTEIERIYEGNERVLNALKAEAIRLGRRLTDAEIQRITKR